MKNNLNINQILIGIILGIIIMKLPYEILILFSYDLLVLLYFSSLLIFISFCLVYILIMRNKIIIKLNVLELSYDRSMRSLDITLSNPNLLEDKELFESIYQTLFNLPEFKQFGYDKILILSCSLASGQIYNLHSNILINNNTSFDTYYNTLEKELTNYNNLQYGYHNEAIINYKVKVWNVDNKKNLIIKKTHNTYSSFNKTGQVRMFNNSSVLNRNWYTGLIKPISLYNNKTGQLKLKHPKIFFTMDIETITINNIQVPIAISSCGYVNTQNLAKLESKVFLIDHVLLLKDKDLAVKELWNKYFTYLESIFKLNNLDKLTIFAHNLGEFDGYFLYNALLNHYNPDHINSIIDDSNSFINIIHNNFPIIEWKDSLRIFPIKLNELCKMFSVEGKLIPYDSRFSNLSLFNNPKLLYLFKKYSIQDSIALYNALQTAQDIYFNKYKIDIESVYSTATLSLKIFRACFQDKPIFILPQKIDKIIREGYYGGGTDAYLAYGEKIHHYDINSLYPFAMLKPMPYNLVKPRLIDLSNRSLDSFFGFAECLIYCPLDMLRPVLPFHHLGKTIYPVGNWKGTYFSEELKAVVKLGYKITLIQGYEFTKTDLFTDYVNYFYEIKRTSTGSDKQIAKLQLNNLYGYFGRKQINLMTENIKNKDLDNAILNRIVKSVTKINDNYSTILSYTNINHYLLEQLNNEFHFIKDFTNPIMSNVALAAAVTAYARIIMIPYKISPYTLYSDTDSAFTLKPIDINLIGEDLGLMKDELKGNIIEEAYFLGPKQYVYYFYDKEGIRKEYSVFAGVPRNSLSFEEGKALFEGKIITKTISNRFYKSFTNLTITIKNSHITIKNNNAKKLINNIYYPPVITNGYNDILLYYYKKFRNLIIKNFKKLIKGF